MHKGWTEDGLYICGGDQCNHECYFRCEEDPHPFKDLGMDEFAWPCVVSEGEDLVHKYPSPEGACCQLMG